jgi:hypothetical protein
VGGGGNINAYRVLLGKLEGIRLIVSPKSRWEDEIQWEWTGLFLHRVGARGGSP